MDCARRRHRSNVDRVSQHRDGRQQGPDAGQQRENFTHSVHASSLRDQPLEDGHAGYSVSGWNLVHQSGRSWLESVRILHICMDIAYATLSNGILNVQLYLKY